MAADAPILVVLALHAEGAGRFEAAGVEVLYTGVGKVNAAITLARRLAKAGASLPLVVNFGTAGSANLPARTLVACRRYDGIAALANGEWIAAHVAGAALRVYEGGHVFFLQDSRALPEIGAFLAG